MSAAPPDNDLLWTRELHCVREGTPALQDVDLRIRKGEIVALTGPRGSGKTTLLGCLAGLLPHRGEVWFDSIPVHDLPVGVRERLRRERFGRISDTPQLLSELTAWENVALPLLLGGTGHRKARRSALEWLERLDAGECAAKRPGQLSRPRQQRVAIARALVHEPSVLFADEPTAPLHQGDRVQALRTLVAAARSHMITTVISGREEEVAPVADRTLRLLDGRLTAGPDDSTVAGPACSLSA
ncbi:MULTISPECIES: ABC transporter ATP-binding protein [unclassified Streptomyces]|uniref:ABC transporter ATP-binding protein n=1 Tax=unclassified Streptomyces TaxID=2593676 RepID=UPI0021565A54|nr:MULTISPECIES: ATP-binding cassette domain-containing protein [unclassified Streptomyces]